MSQLSQPSSSISARDMGRNGAGPKRAAQNLRYEKMFLVSVIRVSSRRIDGFVRRLYIIRNRWKPKRARYRHMCELLGMSASVPTDICFSFAGLMRRGGHTGPHKDGWGIAFYDGKGCRTFHDPAASAHSPIADFLRGHSIKSEIVIS